MKDIDSKANNKSPGNYSLRAKLYKYFSAKLATVLLDVYGSWEKLVTMSVTSRTGIMKNVIKKILQNMDPFHF